MPSPRSKGQQMKWHIQSIAIVIGLVQLAVHPLAFGQAAGGRGAAGGGAAGGAGSPVAPTPTPTPTPTPIPKTAPAPTNPSQAPGPGNSTAAQSLGSPSNQVAPQNVGSNQAWVVRNNLLNNAPQSNSTNKTASSLSSFRNGLSRTNPYSPRTEAANSPKGLAKEADPVIKSNTQGLLFLSPSPLAQEK